MKGRIGILPLVFAILCVSCGGGGSGDSGPPSSPPPPPPPPTYKVGGNVSGMFGRGLVLVLNGAESRSPASNGAFKFDTAIASGASYEVSIVGSPVDETCTIQGGSGTVSGTVNSIRVRCSHSKPLLRAIPDFGRITLRWSADGPVDVVYSSDPDCDWDNYATCPDGTLIRDRKDKLVLRNRDGLVLNRNYFFVVEHDGSRSRQAGAAAWRAGVGGQAQGVYAMAHQDGTIYVGGDFQAVQPTGAHSAVFNPHSGDMVGALHQLDPDGWVYAAASDGKGGWVIGGDFRGVGGVEQRSLAKIRLDGSIDRSWSPAVQGSVHAVAVDGSRVIIAGLFSMINDVSRSGLAALDLQTGELLDWPVSPTRLSGTTQNSEIIVVDGRVLISGRRLGSGDANRHGVIAFDAATGAVLDWNATLNSPQFEVPEVSAMVVIGDTVFVGGDFVIFGGALRSNIAALDFQTGELDSWNPSANRIVTGLVNRNGKLIVGGMFTEIAESGRFGLAAFDASSKALLQFGPDAAHAGQSRITKMTLVGDQLAVVGALGDMRDWLGGSDNLGVWLLDADSGSVRGRIIETRGFVDVIGSDGAAIYVGGGSAGGEARRNLAAFDAETGELSAWSPGVTGPVHAIAVDEGSVYVGGSFNGAYDQGSILPAVRNDLAEFGAVDGLLSEWFPNVRGNSIDAFSVLGTDLLVGGSFSRINDILYSGFAAFDLRVPGRAFADGYPIAGRVVGMHVNENVLYLIGSVGSIGSDERYKLAAFDLEAGELLAWTPEIDGSVAGLTSSGTAVFVSGLFQSVDGAARPNIAAFDSSTGNLTGWIPDAPDTSSAIVVHDAVLYSAGHSTIESFDTTTGARLPFARSFVGRVSSLLTIGDTLYIGGPLNGIDGEPRRGLAAFDLVTGDVIW